MKSKIIIKSPLRYPGGKSRALNRILSLVPEYDEFREPMVGGGSVFFTLKQRFPTKKYWINDKNTELYLFWTECRDNVNKLITKIKYLDKNYIGRDLYYHLKSLPDTLDDLDRAARFFILNRITFSGLVDSGGYSREAHKLRFTPSSIKRIRQASKILKGVKITNLDYSKLLKKSGNNVFIFLDPPYFSKTKTKLYGNKGDLHLKFDHDVFFNNVVKGNYKSLITYDNCAKINNLFDVKTMEKWNKNEWKLQYGTNNGIKNQEKKKATVGRELFIYNYQIRKTSEALLVDTELMNKLN